MPTFQKKYTIVAPKDLVYEAFYDTELIEQWSGAKARIEFNEGGEWALWGETILGTYTSINEDVIVQTWKEEDWEKSSKCTIKFTDLGEKTHVEIIHEDIPLKSYKSIAEGWDLYYMLPLKELVEEISGN